MRVHPIAINMHQQHNKPVLQSSITIKVMRKIIAPSAT